MRNTVKDLIYTILKDEWNYYQAEIKFLKHQRTLPPEHRKVEIPDEQELGLHLRSMDIKCEDLQEGINEVMRLPTTNF